MKKVKSAYVRRCAGYVQWLPDQKDALGLFRVDRSIPDTATGEFDALQAMHMWETHGKEVPCNQPYLLDCLKKGKTSREFHIKGWLSMTRLGEARPEEFFGCLGLRSAEEFRSVFGRSLILSSLREIHQRRETMLQRLA